MSILTSSRPPVSRYSDHYDAVNRLVETTSSGLVGGGGLWMVAPIHHRTTRATQVPGSIGFRSSFGLAVSKHQDLILISGAYWDGVNVVCGIFGLMVKDGTVREVLHTIDCHAEEAWTDLSLSPDGLKAVAMHKAELVVIDLTNGSTRPVHGEFINQAAMGVWYNPRQWFRHR
jgi:hypothetical protein